MAGLSAFLFLSGLVLVPFAAKGANALWDSRTYASYIDNDNMPVIDATNFYNAGTWYIDISPFPFHTADTLNYYNRGHMYSSVGWDFDLSPASSGGSLTLRSTSGSFTNDTAGIIQSDDGEIITTSSGANYVSYLLVSATNIVNKGMLEAGSSGQIMLVGTNVDVSRSTVEIVPTTSSSSYGSTPYFTTKTNIVPAKGFSYLYWGQTNMNFASSNLWDGSLFKVPTFNAKGLCQADWHVSGSFYAGNNFTFYTNHLNGFVMATNSLGGQYQSSVATNVVHEVVFIIPPAQTNLTGDVRFTPSLNNSNHFDTVAVQLTQTFSNLVTKSQQINTFYLVDSLASTTNTGFYTAPPSSSSICSDPTYQPQNYLVSRSDLYLPDVLGYGNSVGNGWAFADGSPGITGLPPANYLYDTQWTNNSVTAKYAALNTFINSITTLPPLGSPVSKAGGRVQIQAGNLNLGRTLMSGEGWIDLQCRHLVDSIGAIVDCQNLSFDLGSTNGTLIFTNLALASVNRFQGNVIAWSATWSNLTTAVVVSYKFDTSSNQWLESDLTNTVSENLYVLVVDGSQLGVPAPVKVLDLYLHATNNNNSANNIVIGDPVIVTNSLLIDGQALTIQKSVELSTRLQQWVWTNAPALRYFTNNGTLTIPDSAHFGDDGVTNYLSFVNNGLITAGGQTIYSDSVQINGGVNDALYSDFDVVTKTGKVAGATINSAGAVQFSADNLLISNSTITAYDAVDFTITSLLSDGGTGSGNVFSCENGFNLWINSGSNVWSGDLRGTTIYDTVLGQAETEHYWSGRDRGAVADGFTNNAAIGRLILDVSDSGSFNFIGTSSSNALYVDCLELVNQATNLDKNWNPVSLTSDDNLVIYYAQAVMNGVSVAEKLNHKNNDHLRWVPSYAGYFSSTNLVYNGVTYGPINAALAQSPSIDSDGDGTANANDPIPFFVSSEVDLTLTVTNRSPLTTLIKWHSTPGATNYVYYSTNVLSTNWLLGFVLTNQLSTGFWPITNAVSAKTTNSAMFYRVWMYPNSTIFYGQ